MDRYREETNQIKELLKQNPQGMTVTEISRQLNKNMHSVGRYLDVLRASGQVDMRQFGMAKVFSLSQRVPISMMLSTISEMVIIMNADLRILEANSRFLQFLQMPRDEVIGKNIEYLPIPDAGIHDLITGVVEALHKKKTDALFQLADPSDRYLKAKVFPIIFEDGSPGSAVILIDITPHKLAENALRESERKYRELVENASSIILKMDSGGNITFFNEFAEQFFGFQEEEILGKNVVGTIVPQTEESGRDLTALIGNICSDTERFQNNENENITRDGRRVWIRWTNRAIFDENGAPDGVLCIGTDITERKQMEEQLRASEKRFRDLADLLPQPVFEADASGTVTYANRQAFREFGCSAEKLYEGLNVLDLLVPGDRARARRTIERIIEEGITSHDEYTAIRMDGTTFPIKEHSSPIIENEQVVGLRGIVFNLTERKLAEQALREESDFITAVLETVDALVLVLDTEGRIVRFNRTCEEVTGYVSDEVLGRTVFDLFLTPDEITRVQDAFHELLSGKAPCRLRNAWVLKDGSTRLIDWSSTILRDRHGQVAYIIGTGIDVTEQMAIEGDLRGCRQQLDRLRTKREYEE
jgi:PAS domain S-box-containing protein